MHSIMKLNGKLYNKKGEITNSHSFMKCPIILLLIYDLTSFIPQSVGAISRYNIWNSNDLQTLEARTRPPSCQLQ